MVMALLFRFEQYLGPLIMLLLKRCFPDIYLSTFFGVRNFGNALAMSVICFLKMCKISSTLQIFLKNGEKAFCF